MKVLEAKRAELIAQLIKLRPDVRNFLASLSCHTTGTASELDDAVQSVMAKAIERLPTYDEHKGGLRPWTLGIAVNVAREQQRLERRFGAVFAAEDAPEGPACPDSSPEQMAAAYELLRRVAQAIARLPETLCQTLVVVIQDGGSHNLARRLRISEEAARKRLERARAALERESGIAGHDLRAALPFLFLGEAEQRRQWLGGFTSIAEMSSRGSHLVAACVAAWLLWPSTPVHTAHKADLASHIPAFVTTTSPETLPPPGPPPSPAVQETPPRDVKPPLRSPSHHLRADKPQALALQTNPKKPRERVDVDVEGLTFAPRP